MFKPLPLYLRGVFYSMQSNRFEAEKHYIKSLELDPDFEFPLRMLQLDKCSRQMGGFLKQDFLPKPFCCWPNEQTIYCFKSHRKQTNCYKIEASSKAPTRTLIYFRCNTPYSVSC